MSFSKQLVPIALFLSPSWSQIPGPPANPEFFSAMSAIWQQVPSNAPQPALQLKGDVEQLVWEEFKPDAHDNGKPGELTNRLTIRYDGNRHEAEREASPNSFGAEIRTISAYSNGRLNSKTTEYLGNDKSTKKGNWERWRYDGNGRIVDFQAGSGDSPAAHRYSDYRYDSQGRPTEWVYRQARDGAESNTAIKYTGNIVETTTFYGGRKGNMRIQTLDTAGHVVDLLVYEGNGKEVSNKPTYHVRFRYDPQGRVILQETDPYKFEAGDDYEPLPGKLVVRYDDSAHTREQSFYDPNGTLAFRTQAELDREGNVVSLRLFDGMGKERQQGELYLPPSSKLPKTRPGKARWEVDYDQQGNWTERRRYFYPADGGERMLMLTARQTIRYRDR